MCYIERAAKAVVNTIFRTDYKTAQRLSEKDLKLEQIKNFNLQDIRQATMFDKPKAKSSLLDKQKHSLTEPVEKSPIINPHNPKPGG